FLELPWGQVKESVQVKLLTREGELYILARSTGRKEKERAIRQRRLKRLWQRLGELQGQDLTRDNLLLKLGAAKTEAGRVYGLVEVRVPKPEQPVNTETFTFRLRKDKLRQAFRREGALSAPLEPLRGRSRRAVATLRSAHRDRSGLSGSEERFSHPPHLSPERLTHRGAYLRIVSGLLFVHHAGAAFAGAGAWSNSSSGAGENVRYSNGGCAGDRKSVV